MRIPERAPMNLRIPVLLYHKLGRPPRGARVPGHYVSPGLFSRHLDYLQRRGYTTISLLDLVAHLRPAPAARPTEDQGAHPESRSASASPPRPVVITFDDGYRCLYEHGLPALAERGMAATVFMVVGAIGGTNTWEQAVGDVAEPMLTLPEIRDMRSHGIEFGSHTLNHAHLPETPGADAAREVADSRARLEQTLGEPCQAFAYPYGEWDLRIRDLVERAGYDIACTTLRAAARPDSDPLALPRINIRRYNITARFAYKLWRAQQVRG
jgi:peptidoglycan/xylan/chitin deacetylase (PgdA/CDA1 family)